MTNKEWARGVERAWKAVAAKATAYADGVIADPVPHELRYAKEVSDAVIEHAQDLKTFLESWMEDAQINRGLWARVPDKIKRDRNTITDIQRVLKALDDGADILSDVKGYAETLYDRVNPESGWRYEPGYFEDEKQWAFLVRGFAHRLKETVTKASALVTKAVKYASDVNTRYIEHVPNEVDVNGVKVVFLDMDTKSKPTEKTQRSPRNRSATVKAMDTARALLERKGLGFLWYGTMRVLPETASEADLSRYTGLKTTATHAWANYNYRNDTVTVFQSVGKTSVASAANTLAHELGHRFWFKFLTETDRARFADEFGDVEAVSEYGSSNPEEDFAEVFAAYVDGRDLTRDQLERLKSYFRGHQKRTAAALDEEYPHREWAEKLLRGWKVQFDGTEEAVLDAMTSGTKPSRVIGAELTGLMHYLDLWQRDAITNRGFQRVKKSKDKPADNKHEEMALYYLGKAEAQGHEFRAQLSGRGNVAVNRQLALINHFVELAAKEFAAVEYQWDDAVPPEQLDIHGTKLVFVQWEADQRTGVIQEVEKAYALLRRKGLDWLWGGVIEVIRAGNLGVQSRAGAWYIPETDTFGLAAFKGGMARSLAHEYGHRLWFKYLDSSERAEFADTFGDVPAVTSYGATNPEEDFAEVFAAFIDGSDLTRDQLERFRKFVSKHQRRASTADLDNALDEIAAPLRMWIHRPSEGKAELADVYASLSHAEKVALAADVARVSDPVFIGYRRSKDGRDRLRGLDSVSTDAPKYMDKFHSYRITADQVLVHWRQDTPLGKGGFAHEHEVILKPGVDIGPFKVRALQAGSFDGFDLFDDVEDVPETAAQAARREFVENIGYGDIIQVGSRKFRVIKTEGVVKYATLHGTKGRNLYQVIVDGDDPFTVNVFEMVDTQTPSKTVFVSGTPRKVGHVAAASLRFERHRGNQDDAAWVDAILPRTARTLDSARQARILTRMKTPKTGSVRVAKATAEKMAARAKKVAAGTEATVPFSAVLARLGMK